ncbi:lytic transglycosylase domain-containing protein [Paraburkholderia bonniea]|uniref:lytic transglycosylase domain-containing protein n=1 Tax=Paraburkholderia bonniea TaxID=2152891 RepID=UPI0012914954|nr:lytic transglycosylase domain-containing protein [Paraburkholderia bonniea]
MKPGSDSLAQVARRQRIWPKAVLACVLCVAAQAQASAVVMMIGGMKNTAGQAASAQPVAAPEPRSSVVTLYNPSGRVSTTFVPGMLMPVTTAPSGTVASRVMALTPLIAEVSHAANIDSALLMAVIDVESGGNPQAVSPKGATGLMQLMPATGKRHGAADLFDPRQNIMAGARYLHILMQQFGNIELALAAYNAGEGAVKKYGMQIPPYDETMAYVPKVLGRYQHYRTRTAAAATPGAPQEARGHFVQVRQAITAAR